MLTIFTFFLLTHFLFLVLFSFILNKVFLQKVYELWGFQYCMGLSSHIILHGSVQSRLKPRPHRQKTSLLAVSQIFVTFLTMDLKKNPLPELK